MGRQAGTEGAPTSYWVRLAATIGTWTGALGTKAPLPLTRTRASLQSLSTLPSARRRAAMLPGPRCSAVRSNSLPMIVIGSAAELVLADAELRSGHSEAAQDLVDARRNGCPTRNCTH